jgi:hypothetical protein
MKTLILTILVVTGTLHAQNPSYGDAAAFGQANAAMIEARRAQRTALAGADTVALYQASNARLQSENAQLRALVARYELVLSQVYAANAKGILVEPSK